MILSLSWTYQNPYIGWPYQFSHDKRLSKSTPKFWCNMAEPNFSLYKVCKNFTVFGRILQTFIISNVKPVLRTTWTVEEFSTRKVKLCSVYYFYKPNFHVKNKFVNFLLIKLGLYATSRWNWGDVRGRWQRLVLQSLIKRCSDCTVTE